jgi:Uma2 family endonuclease
MIVIKGNEPSEMVSTVAETQPLATSRARHRFSRQDYDAMIAAGILDEDDRVELIEGEILTKMSIGPSHASTVRRLTAILYRSIADRCIVSVQDPVALDDFSEPEPDLALFKSREDLYSKAHPTPDEVYLIVEVADSSVRLDRLRKIPLYAAAAIPEVWLIDLVERCVVKYRKPMGGVYSEITRYRAGEHVSIDALPGVQLDPRDLGL